MKRFPSRPSSHIMGLVYFIFAGIFLITAFLFQEMRLTAFLLLPSIGSLFLGIDAFINQPKMLKKISFYIGITLLIITTIVAVIYYF